MFEVPSTGGTVSDAEGKRNVVASPLRRKPADTHWVKKAGKTAGCTAAGCAVVSSRSGGTLTSGDSSRAGVAEVLGDRGEPGIRGTDSNTRVVDSRNRVEVVDTLAPHRRAAAVRQPGAGQSHRGASQCMHRPEAVLRCARTCREVHHSCTRSHQTENRRPGNRGPRLLSPVCPRLAAMKLPLEKRNAES